MVDDLNLCLMEDNLNLVIGKQGSWDSVCNLILTSLDKNKEDNIEMFENGRQPIFFNGRQPNFCV